MPEPNTGGALVVEGLKSNSNCSIEEKKLAELPPVISASRGIYPHAFWCSHGIPLELNI